MQFPAPSYSIFLINIFINSLPFPAVCVPSIPQDRYPGVKLRLVNVTDSFDEDFLQRALRGQLPGITHKYLLDLAQWFYAKSIPCCEKLLDQMDPHRRQFNCKALPDPVDHNSTVFLYRMIFECIGERRNARPCCMSRGVRSDRCLRLCDASNPAVDVNSLESARSTQFMDTCAAEQKMAKEPFLWMLFQCLNPDFSRVLRLTQEIKAGEEARE